MAICTCNTDRTITCIAHPKRSKPTGRQDAYGFTEYQRHDGSLYWSKPMTGKDRMRQKEIDDFHKSERLYANSRQMADIQKKLDRGE